MLLAIDDFLAESMELNYLAITAAAVGQFVVGALWYMFLFGKMWARIHGFDLLSKDVQQSMMKQMPLYYALQFGVSLLSAFVLALAYEALPVSWNMYGIAGFIWLGFILPTQYGAVIFGGTEPQWIWRKLGIMTGGSLACLLAAAVVFSFIG